MLNFTAIDFETANHKRGSVCSIGIAQVRNGQLIGSFHSTIMPPPGLQTFTPMHMSIHHITPSMVQQSPTWPDIVQWLAQVVPDDVLVAHNAPFERSVIRQASAACGINEPVNKLLCSLKLARSMKLQLINNKLNTLMAYYHLPMLDHHNAEADAIMSAQITLKMAEQIGINETEHLIRRCSLT